jgi:hypothetical protein
VRSGRRPPDSLVIHGRGPTYWPKVGSTLVPLAGQLGPHQRAGIREVCRHAGFESPSLADMVSAALPVHLLDDLEGELRHPGDVGITWKPGSFGLSVWLRTLVSSPPVWAASPLPKSVIR